MVYYPRETRFFSNAAQIKPYWAGSEKDYVYNQVNQGLANLAIDIKMTISGLYEKRQSSFNELFTASHIYLALTVFPLRSVLQFYIRVIQYLLHLKFVAPKGYAKFYLKRFIFL